MLPRGLEEMVYRIRQEVRRHIPSGNVEEIGIIRGSYDRASFRWYFKADVGYHQQCCVVMDAREIFEQRFNIPSYIDEILIGRYRRGERYPDVELRSGGRVWHIPDALPITTSSFRPGQIMTMDHNVAVTPIRDSKDRGKSMLGELYEQYKKLYARKEAIAMEQRWQREYAMYCDPAENVAPKEKSRKQQLAESRPERLARLWKAKYERDGKKPLINKLQTV